PRPAPVSISSACAPEAASCTGESSGCGELTVPLGTSSTTEPLIEAWHLRAPASSLCEALPARVRSQKSKHTLAPSATHGGRASEASIRQTPCSRSGAPHERPPILRTSPVRLLAPLLVLASAFGPAVSTGSAAVPFPMSSGNYSETF